jgi:hydrogenase maturation factor
VQEILFPTFDATVLDWKEKLTRLTAAEQQIDDWFTTHLGEQIAVVDEVESVKSLFVLQKLPVMYYQ